MVPAIRKAYNQAFSPAAYQAYLHDLNNLHPGALEFRVAETPVFIDKGFKEKVLDACEAIVDVICQPDFMAKSAIAIPANVNVPNETGHSHFIAFDFGICENEAGELEPQLIEMQGFPTLFGYQIFQDQITRKHFSIPEQYSCYLNGYNAETYANLAQRNYLGQTRCRKCCAFRNSAAPTKNQD